MTRQPTTTAPMASRGAQFRAAQMQRGAPTTTQRADKPADDEDDDEKPKKEPLFGRDEDPTLDNPDANETDTDPDDEDKDDIQIVVVS